MEVVSVAAGVGVAVGDVLGSPQTTSQQPSYQAQHHSLRACLQPNQAGVGDEEDDYEDDSRMDTEEDLNGDVSSPSPPQTQREDDEDSTEDQMDFDDNMRNDFLDDDDSSSRVYPEEGMEGGVASPTTSRPKPGGGGGSGRRNKRKNFQPRNIVYFADSDDDEGGDDGRSNASRGGHREREAEEETPLDLSDNPIRSSLLPRRIEELTSDASSGGENPRMNPMFGAEDTPTHQDSRIFAEQAMRRFLGLCGLQDSLSPGFAGSSFLSGKLLESLKSNGALSAPTGESNSGSGNGSGEPPTPPHTPQREALTGAPSNLDGPGRNQGVFDHQALQARLLGETNFSTLLTLAALQEGNNSVAGVPLPPTLDPSKSLPTTPTTPTSTAVSPSLANLSLRNGGRTPPNMVSGLGVRDSMNKQAVDYTRYVKRYLSALECGSQTCRELNHREHFHCMDCNFKVFSKKEEMIRHFKWHKKRDESLQHGFMRYSPTDDCSDRFSSCSHNRKQTHYHCLKEHCDKVYISTSDVQMHANYHRKDSAIMQEGFQRFRASEDCNHVACTFAGQRTTHFHCIRSNCNFTFKNKADMEKHKTYHIKDEQLTKDGFKKFMKQEDCGYDDCKLSKVANHIHCIRPDCNYVLHSSGQIFAHKRKHERQEHEKAYRKYKFAQTMLGVPDAHPALTPLLHEALRPLGSLSGAMMGGSPFGNDVRGDESSSPLDRSSSPQGASLPPPPPQIMRPSHPSFLMSGFPPPGFVDGQHPLARLLGVPPPAAHSIFPPVPTSTSSTPASSSSGPASPVDLTVGVSSGDERDWERFVRCYGRDDSCRSGCELSGIEHWHCEECEALFHTRDSAKEHGRVHEQQIAITEENYTRVTPGESARSCPSECQIEDQAEHFHCNWDGCGEAILASGDKPFRRLEHYRIHDFARRLPSGVMQTGMNPGVASVTSIDAMFKRKRGRPPKNRVIEVWNEYLPVSSSHDSPQAIFTSFKLPKSSPPPHHPSMSNVGVPSNPLLGMMPPGMGPLGHLAHMGRDMMGGSVPGMPGSMSILPPLTLSNSKPPLMFPIPRENSKRNISQSQSELSDEESPTSHSLGPLSPIYLHKPRPDSPMDTPSVDTGSPVQTMDTPSKSQPLIPVVKSSGIFYPLSPFPTPSQIVPRTTSSSVTSNEPGALITPIPPSASRSTTLPTFTLPVSSSGCLTITATRHSPGLPPHYSLPHHLESMDQDDSNDSVKASEHSSARHDEHSNGPVPSTETSTPRSLMSPLNESIINNTNELADHHRQYGQDISCGRPFCKLKKKDHYHCQICNQAFSEQEKLRPHILKHMTGIGSQLNSSEDGDGSIKEEDIQEIEDTKLDNEDLRRSYSPPLSSSSSINSPNSMPILGLSSSTSPRIPLCSLSGPQHPQFPSHLIYSQAAGFHGLHSPFVPHLSISSMFPGSLPRLLPPGTWPGVHPALAAMTHPHLMLPQMRSNGELPPPGHHPQLGNMNQSSVGPSGITSPNDHHNSMLSNSLNTSPHLALLGKRLGPDDYSMQDAKKIRASNSIRILKDEPVPEGYIRFRFNEDCKYPHCGYREHQTHFHCVRKDCGYSFCDKTRFVQHTARHERLDTLMGGDFQQFRSNVPCGRSECAYASMIGQQQNKASHFHCFKCDFVCTDTNKVVAHRRQHQKRDSINAAGFEKFTPSQPCSIQSCSHNQKQTHYHCLKCQYSVLGLSQMSAHKFRHLEC